MDLNAFTYGFSYVVIAGFIGWFASLPWRVVFRLASRS